MVTAQAQGAANEVTARLDATLNRSNTITPYGKLTNTNFGDQPAQQSRRGAAAV